MSMVIYILEELDNVDENGGYNERDGPSPSELSLTSLSHEGEPRGWIDRRRFITSLSHESEPGRWVDRRRFITPERDPFVGRGSFGWGTNPGEGWAGFKKEKFYLIIVHSGWFRFEELWDSSISKALLGFLHGSFRCWLSWVFLAGLFPPPNCIFNVTGSDPRTTSSGRLTPLHLQRQGIQS